MDITLQQVIDVVRAAGSLFDRSGGFEIHDKGARENLVTSSDLAVQHFLTERLGALLPGSGFLCEEEDLRDTAHRDVWIIDPIDGTATPSWASSTVPGGTKCMRPKGAGAPAATENPSGSPAVPSRTGSSSRR